MEGNRCQVVERCVKIVSYMSWRGIKSVVSVGRYVHVRDLKEEGGIERGRDRERIRNGGR